QSSGGLADPAQLLAKDTILSGPAGGMVGAVRVAAQAGLGSAPIVGFDMGGTSTDEFHFDGSRGDLAWERSADTEIAGLHLQAPMLPIHTVAAGGGSVLHFDGQRLQVGPQSAGADPGPACYRRGGPLTITDANLLLGRLCVDRFPAVFGPGRDQPPDPEVVGRLFRELAARMGRATAAQAPAVEQVAEGALAIAVERMAEAIRRISIQRGHDIRRAVLVCYGGAGGQHACRLAEALGLPRVLLHPLAGVLSAYGMGLAEQRLLLEAGVRRPLSPGLPAELETLAAKLAAEGRRRLREGGTEGGEPEVLVQLELRRSGSEQGLLLAFAPQAAVLARAFAEAHLRRFGYRPDATPAPVVERLQVELVVAPSPTPSGAGRPAIGPTADSAADPIADGPAAPATTPLHLPGRGWVPVPLWQRERLRAGQRLEGPALIAEATGMVVLEPGWTAHRRPGGELLLERSRPGGARGAAGEALAAATAGAPDPVRLELYNHRFSAIAEQMGVRLRQTSQSVNIRERLDFSCAVFDAAGRLVANAPHIPVHLGSMGASVASLLAAVARGERPPLAPGDALASNDPFDGGTHLPDITVISPVFPPDADEPDRPPLFYVACRGHHADVGGITPGSMPPFSHRIEEEGLLLRHVPLVSGGRFDAAGWRERLAAGPHPVRNPEQLLADLQAQVAANRLGAGELHRLMEREGEAEVRAYMAHVQANAAAAVRRMIGRLREGSHAVELDDGARIAVAVSPDPVAGRVRVDFTGTSPQQEGNLNAPLAITRAVVLYVFRCLVGEPIPLNDGCFEPIDLVVPPGCLLRPAPPAAVVAGNVETSQAVTNALFGALGVMAAAQGTMNNLSFGDERRQYYETICGGTGAGRGLDGHGFAGADAVQSHMTNSRLTDPEILEDRFPVRLESFAIRRGSGGAGRWRGGDGVVRELSFLAPMTASILSGSRRVPPFGLAGGESGQCGRNRLVRSDGRVTTLPGSVQLDVAVGDRLVIETPGGGGFGPRPEGPAEATPSPQP
ncbi:MAG: hydantoinase B/oxoprolinase family protein, partial [Synechococcaceae cyanobacterium]|nr:hydantoinase B/oxoprolinase family protein [Synechococcaceae cyanobacterium]